MKRIVKSREIIAQFTQKHSVISLCFLYFLSYHKHYKDIGAVCKAGKSIYMKRYM